MLILVINCGSSSIKYQVFDAEADECIAQGLLERVGTDESSLAHRSNGAETRIDEPTADHEAGLALIAKTLTDPAIGCVRDLAEIAAVGHRVVHGAEEFVESTVIDDDVIAAIERCASLAPLHNPPNLMGIRGAMRIFPHAVNVAVFDTAFHGTIPRHAYLYALPYELYTKHGIRRYGFHGTSHRYVSARAAEFLGREPADVNLITLHLGNGCSAAAVRGGKSVDTSMGLTPLEGLVMGTRSGDIDPAIVFHLADTLAVKLDDINDMLNKKSGLLGVSGVSNDMRDVTAAAEGGDERAALALEIFAYRARKYVGAYMAVLGEVDALVFTGGIGENDAEMRERIVRGLDHLGVVLDRKANAAAERGERDVADPSARVRILVIPTDEELLIAHDTETLARRVLEASK